MKIIIIDHYYQNFLDNFYKKNLDVGNKSYADQKKIIFDQCFGTANFYSKNLIKLGYQAEEVIYNNETLQKQWAKENNLKISHNYFDKIPKLKNLLNYDFAEKILEAQIINFQPDVIYCQSLSVPSQKFLKKIKKYTKLIVGQVASPIIFDYKKLSQFNLILTSFPHFVELFNEISIKSEYFKIGFEASILEKLKKTEKKYETVFIGGFSKYHKETVETFEYLSKNSPIDFWGYGYDILPKNSIINKKYHGEAWGIDMYNILYNSKISVNRHINAAKNYANNMRLYESTGVGAMLITDHKDNINELFKVGKEIETYKSKGDLVEKINYYLKNEDERKKIAIAGQEKTLANHTYEKRMIELTQILNKYI